MAPTAPITTAAKPGKFLTVAIDDEIYGIPVLKAREIIRFQKVTPVPQVPAFVKGVINLRGRVIPIIDLRIRFGMKADTTEATCIVVVQVALWRPHHSSGTRRRQRGWRSQTSRPTRLKRAPGFPGVARIDTNYLLGMAKATNGRWSSCCSRSTA